MMYSLCRERKLAESIIPCGIVLFEHSNQYNSLGQISLVSLILSEGYHVPGMV